MGAAQQVLLMLSAAGGGGLTSPQTFTSTGADQSMVVPAGVTTITARVWAGGGGSNGATSGMGDKAFGGPGGFVKCDIPVTPAETLTILVAKGGQKGGSTRYPGRGGGLSGIKRGSTWLVIAGGGGGSGGYGNSNTKSWGGIGGGTTAGAGRDADNGGAPFATGGGAGTPSAGGTGGTPTDSAPDMDGAQYQGGNGSGNSSASVRNYYQGGATRTSSERGGGGGGGYYGGGGGGGGGTWGAGGGGGSSYTDASCSTVTHTQGTVTSGTGSTAPATGEAGYQSGVAVGGLHNNDGGPGLIYLTW